MNLLSYFVSAKLCTQSVADPQEELEIGPLVIMWPHLQFKQTTNHAHAMDCGQTQTNRKYCSSILGTKMEDNGHAVV